MASLIKKAWVYVPNEYTTKFTLTATFGDGQTEVFSYNKTDGSWAPAGAQSRRIAVIAPSSPDESRFIVRAFVDDPFVSLTASYGNATSTKTAESVNMTKMVFDKNFFNNRPFTASSGDLPNPYFIFDDEDLADIYFTNLTSELTLPTKKYNFGSWYGWGVYNETKPYSEMLTNPGGFRIMPLSWIFSWKLTGYPNISASASTNSHPGLNSAVEAPIVNNKLYMVPLYHYENPQFDIDTKDYRIDTTPVMYSVSVTAGEGGSVQSSVLSVQAGGIVVLKAVPDVGCTFSQWSDGDTNAVKTITNVQENITLMATFSEMQAYSIIESAPSVDGEVDANIKVYLANNDGNHTRGAEITTFPYSIEPGTSLIFECEDPNYYVSSVLLSHISDQATYDSAGNAQVSFQNGSSYWYGSANHYLNLDNEYDGHEQGNAEDDKSVLTSKTPSTITCLVYLAEAPLVNITMQSTTGGIATVSNRTPRKGETVVLNVATEDGYLFNGWNDGDNSEIKFVSPNSDTTYKAYFIPDDIIENAVTDYDGNSYDAIVIGDKVWMLDNYRSTHAADGTAINGYKSPNNDNANVEEYGLLYKYDNTDILNGDSKSSFSPSGVQGVAPNDWHIPSDSEYREVVQYGTGFLTRVKPGNFTYDYSILSETPVGFGEKCGYLTSSDNNVISLTDRYDNDSENPRYHIYKENGAYGVESFSLRCVYDGTPEQLRASLAGNTPETRTVTVTTGAGGTAAGSKMVLSGASAMISATADDDHRFVKWSDDNTENPRLLSNITADVTLSAVFGDPDYFYLEAEEVGSTVSATTYYQYGDFITPVIMYSTDGTNFSEWSTTKTTDNGSTTYTYDTITLSNIGDKVYFYHNNAYAGEDAHDFHFVLTGAVAAGGNFHTMAKKNGITNWVFGEKYEGNTIFYNCTALTHAPDFPNVEEIGWMTNKGLYRIFDNLTFPMSDDGENFNFAFNATGPNSDASNYLKAYYLGNTTGFNVPAIALRVILNYYNPGGGITYQDVLVDDEPIADENGLTTGWSYVQDDTYGECAQKTIHIGDRVKFSIVGSSSYDITEISAEISSIYHRFID